MISRLTGSSWLLALCGVLEAIVSVTYFKVGNHGASSWSMIVFLGILSMGAGACTLAAALFLIQPTPGSRPEIYWLGFFFAFSACCLLGLAVGSAREGVAAPGAPVCL